MAKGLDISKLAERLNQLNTNNNHGEGSGIKFINIKDGRNVFRILPGKGDNFFVEEVWVHYGVGKNANNQNGTMVVCPTTKGDDKPCPVCELSKQFKSMSKKKDDSYDKQAKSFYRKKRVYYNAIDRGDAISNYEKREDGKWYNIADDEEASPVKVLGTGIGVYKDLLKLITDPEYGDITKPEDGLDVIITKSGSGQFNTEYDVKTVRKESPIGFNAWEECLNDLVQLAQPKSYDDIAKLLTGESSGSSNSESKEDDTPEDVSEIKDEDVPFPVEDEGGTDDDALQAEIKAALAARRKGK